MNKHGFTLAEILITLGIIGVVSAMTLPTVIKNYQKKVASTRVKTAYSQLLQTIQRSEVDNGEIKSWDFETTSTETFTKKYIEPYFKGMTLCTNFEKCPTGISLVNADRRYFFNNGVQIDFYRSMNTIYILADIDGPKGKNTMGYDWFYFTYNKDLNRIMPFGWFDGITKEDILNGTQNRCTKDTSIYNYRHGCTALLMLLGWEMTNDYPW